MIMWKLYSENNEICGEMFKSLTGHNHFVSDCAISKDGGFIVSSSWDKTLRLWDIERCVTKRIFNGHTNDVMSVAFSGDNRQIVSGSRDSTVRLWNTLAVQKFVFEEKGHIDCVSSVLTLPQSSSLSIVSSGWDRVIKFWSLKPAKCQKTFSGHTNAINSISICPDGSLMASGSKDGSINVWNLIKSELDNKYLAGDSVNCVSFNPHFFLMAAAVGSTILLYNLSTRTMYQTVSQIDLKEAKTLPTVTTLTWSNDGCCLYAGYTDNNVRIFGCRPDTKN
ncbi:hypothetical protein MXB_2289 [Myxobolus squamalis]|nr:hypothetical protein MXB_2289 [Myxobolus squamalis]